MKNIKEYAYSGEKNPDPQPSFAGWRRCCSFLHIITDSEAQKDRAQADEKNSDGRRSYVHFYFCGQEFLRPGVGARDAPGAKA